MAIVNFTGYYADGYTGVQGPIIRPELDSSLLTTGGGSGAYPARRKGIARTGSTPSAWQVKPSWATPCEWALGEIGGDGVLAELGTYQTGYLTFWLRVEVRPTTANAMWICRLKVGATDFAARILCNTDGTLQLQYNAAGGWTNIGSASSAVPIKSWHKVGFKAEGTNTPGSTAFEFQLDNSSVASSTGLTLAVSGTIKSWYTGTDSQASDGVTLYYDDSMWKSDGYGDDGACIVLRPFDQALVTGWKNYGTGDTTYGMWDSNRLWYPWLHCETENNPLQLYPFPPQDYLIRDGDIVAAKTYTILGLDNGSTGVAGSAIEQIVSGSTTVSTSPGVALAKIQSGGTGGNLIGSAVMEVDPDTSAAWTLTGLRALKHGPMATAITLGTGGTWNGVIQVASEVAVWVSEYRTEPVLYADGFEVANPSNLHIYPAGRATIVANSTERVRTGHYAACVEVTNAACGAAWTDINRAYMPALLWPGFFSTYLPGATGRTGSEIDEVYTTYWVNVEQRPSSVAVPICEDNGQTWRVYLSPTGTLQLKYHSATGETYTVVGSASDPISTDEWHRIDLGVENAEGRGGLGRTYTLKVDGTQVAQATDCVTYIGTMNVTDGQTYPWLPMCGFSLWDVSTNTVGDTFKVWYDDVVVRRDEFQPDDGGLLLLKANADGASSGSWTGTYADINQVPPDSSTFVTHSGPHNSYKLFEVQSFEEGYLGGDVSFVMTYDDAYRAEGGDWVFTRRRQVGASGRPRTSESASASAKFLAWTADSTTPDGAGWTHDDIDALQIGLMQEVDYPSTEGPLTVYALGAIVWCSDPQQVPPLPTTPQFGAIAPTHGPVNVTTNVTITGELFDGVTGVTVDGTACTSFVLVDSYTITCTVPVGTVAGKAHIVLQHPDGDVPVFSGWLYDTVIRGSGLGTAQAAATSLAVAVPTGTALNDIMLCFVYCRGTTTTMTQADWTKKDTRASADGQLVTWWRRAGSSEPASYTFSFGASVKASAVMISVIGIDPDLADPIDQYLSQANSSSTNIVAPTITPGHNDEMLIFAGGTSYGTTISPPSSPSMVELGEQASTGAGASSRTTTEVASSLLVGGSGTSTGTRTAVAGNAGANAGILVALKIHDAVFGVAAGLLESEPALYAPTITSPGQGFSVSLQDGVAALYAAALEVQAPNLVAQLLDSGLALYAPSLSIGSLRALELDLLDGEASLYAATVGLYNLLGALTLLDSGVALYAPTVTLAPLVTALGFLESAAALSAPTLLGLALVGALSLLDGSSALYSPLAEISQILLELTLVNSGALADTGYATGAVWYG